MAKQNIGRKLTAASPKLPYGAKAKIAEALKENRHNVQTAFRGLAGPTLTMKVFKKAKKLYPAIVKPTKQKPC